MIRKTVYFRDEEDVKKWEAIENKAAWLHEHLNGELSTNNLNAQVKKVQDALVDRDYTYEDLEPSA